MQMSRAPPFLTYIIGILLVIIDWRHSGPLQLFNNCSLIEFRFILISLPVHCSQLQCYNCILLSFIIRCACIAMCVEVAMLLFTRALQCFSAFTYPGITVCNLPNLVGIRWVLACAAFRAVFCSRKTGKSITFGAAAFKCTTVRPLLLHVVCFVIYAFKVGQCICKWLYLINYLSHKYYPLINSVIV